MPRGLHAGTRGFVLELEGLVLPLPKPPPGRRRTDSDGLVRDCCFLVFVPSLSWQTIALHRSVYRSENSKWGTCQMILAGRRPQPSHFSAPRPRTVGFDQTRFGMLAAVLQRAHTDLFRGAEVFLNVPGGMRALDGGRGDPVRNTKRTVFCACGFLSHHLSSQARDTHKTRETPQDLNMLCFLTGLRPRRHREPAVVSDWGVVACFRSLLGRGQPYW